MSDFETATETGQVMIVTIEDKKIYKRSLLPVRITGIYGIS